MNAARVIVVSMLAALALLFVCVASCATTPAGSHRTVEVSGPTPLLTGPAMGHWAEQNEHPVMLYTVLGNECEFLANQEQAPAYESHGTFVLAPGVTLCAIQLRNPSQTILLHVER